MKKKILMIEDNPDILEITEYLLSENGYEVVAAPTTDILSDLPHIKPDIILLDGTSGHKQCKTLKSTDTTKNIPVIIISAANGIEKIAQDCLADCFVKKPFDADHLLEVVENQLVIAVEFKHT